MVVGVYGGSFNPPHVGHAMVAGWLLWTRRVDEVWLVPTWQHAFEKKLAPWPVRLEACQALGRAIGPGVHVHGIESELPAPSFTVRTLDALALRHPEARFRLVLGVDVLAQTGGWKDWARIQGEFAPIVVGRAGHDAVSGSPTFPEVSSTDIRDRIERGDPVDHLVPAGVLAVWRGARS